MNRRWWNGPESKNNKRESERLFYLTKLRFQKKRKRKIE